MGVLICRVDIGDGRDQGVFCGNNNNVNNNNVIIIMF